MGADFSKPTSVTIQSITKLAMPEIPVDRHVLEKEQITELPHERSGPTPTEKSIIAAERIENDVIFAPPGVTSKPITVAAANHHNLATQENDLVQGMRAKKLEDERRRKREELFAVLQRLVQSRIAVAQNVEDLLNKARDNSAIGANLENICKTIVTLVKGLESPEQIISTSSNNELLKAIRDVLVEYSLSLFHDREFADQIRAAFDRILMAIALQESRQQRSLSLSQNQEQEQQTEDTSSLPNDSGEVRADRERFAEETAVRTYDDKDEEERPRSRSKKRKNKKRQIIAVGKEINPLADAWDPKFDKFGVTLGCEYEITDKQNEIDE